MGAWTAAHPGRPWFWLKATCMGASRANQASSPVTASQPGQAITAPDGARGSQCGSGFCHFGAG